MLLKKNNKPIWNRAVAAVLAVSMVLIPVEFPGSANAVEENPVEYLYQDDFAEDRYANGATDAQGVVNKWENLIGDPEEKRFHYQWNTSKLGSTAADVTNGRYEITSTANDRPVWLDITEGTAQNAVHYWTDYTVEADITRVATNTAVGPSLLGRVQYDEEHGNYTYYKAFFQASRLYLRKRYYDTTENAWKEIVLLEKGAVIPSGTVAHVAMTVVGKQVSASISWKNDSEVDQTVTVGPYTDDGQYGSAILYGSVGLMAYGASSATLDAAFDNVKVTFADGTVAFHEQYADARYFSGKDEQVTIRPKGDTEKLNINYQWDTNGYSGTIAEGKYTMTATTTGQRYNHYLVGSTLDGFDATSVWTDYTVEADITRNQTDTTAGAYLYGRVQKTSEGYIGYVAYVHQSQLYLLKNYIDGNGKLQTYKVFQETGHSKSFKLPDEYKVGHVTLSFKGNKVTLTGNYDGLSAPVVIELTDDGILAGEPITHGSIGIGVFSQNGATINAGFDNIKVTLDNPTETVFEEKWTLEEGQTSAVYLAASRTAEEAMTVPAWSVKDGTIKSTSKNPSTVCITSKKDDIDLAISWKNYAAAAEVTLNTPTSTAGIVANASGDTYYELRMSSSKLELYKVMDGNETLLSTSEGMPVPADFKAGEPQQLKLVISKDGKTVFGCVNSVRYVEYIATSEESVPETGTAGLRACGNASFDNFSVYPAQQDTGKAYGAFSFGVEDGRTDLLDGSWVFGNGWTVKDRKLLLTGSEETVSYLTENCKLDNYSAAYQVILPETGHVTVMGRYSADTNSAYKVTVDPTAGVTLSKMVEGTDGAPAKAISRSELYQLGIKLIPGAAQSIKLYMYGNLLRVYIDDTQVACWVDVDEPLTEGVAAISGSTGTKLTSVITAVALPLADLTILSGTCANADTEAVIDEANPIEVPLGKIPDVTKLWLQIGADEIIPLDNLVISKLDGSAPGTKTADVIYDGRIVKLYYKGVDRSAQITALVGSINDLSEPSALTIGDAAAVEALYRKYVDLSAAEKETVDAGAVTKLMAAREAILDLQYEEDLGDVVFSDTFDTEESEKLYTNDYNLTGQVDVGNWYVSNGEMMMYDISAVKQPSGFSAANMLIDKNFQVSSVSVDVQFLEQKAAAGILFNMVSKEWYALRIADSAKGNRLTLNKQGYTLETYTTDNKTADPGFAGFQAGQWYNLRVTVSETGLIRCYVDGRLWFEHQDQASADVGDVRNHGTVALIASENWVKYDNLEVRGVELPYEAPAQDTPDMPQQNYTDDFENETVGKDPSHWLERTDGDRWYIKADGGNKVYASKDSLADATQTWLHVFETDVDYTAKLRADEIVTYSAMALTARVYADTSYFRAGYDFGAKKWFIKTRNGADFAEQTFWGADGTVEAGQWCSLNLKVQGTVIALYVDGNDTPVATADAGRKVGPGKVGVYTEQCNISVDDVDLKQLSGQSIVQDGVMEQYTAQAGATEGTLFCVMEVKDAEGRDALLLNEDSSRHYISYDGGMTWTKTTDYSKTGFGGGSLVKLHDGSLLNVKNNTYVKRSTDGGLTWTTQCGDMTQFHAPGRGYAQPAEHLSEVQLADGSYRIFFTIGDQGETVQTDGITSERSTISEVYYSDDVGVTWKMSENSPLNVSRLNVWGESHVLSITKETKDFTGRTLPVGTLVHYSTYNSSDSMRYSLSFDGGVTWEGDYAMPDIPCGMNSMTIDYDWDEKVYYMATTVSVPKLYNHGFPRERVVLLISEDGYNWKLAADVDRWGDVSSTDLGVLMQSVNMYLYISKDHVFVSFSRSEAFSDSSSHNLQVGRLYRFEKDKLQVRDWKGQYTVPDKTVVGIEAVQGTGTYPDLTAGTQTQLDAAALTGSKLIAYYYDGTSEQIDMSNAYAYGTVNAAGKTVVTVDYKLFRAVYTVNEQVSFYSANIALGDSLTMYYYLKKDDFEGEDYYAVIRRSYGSGKPDQVITVPFSEFEDYKKDNLLRIPYAGIAAKEMGDIVSMTVYNGQGVQVSTTKTDSVKLYSYRGLANEEFAGKYKIALVDLLNFGAACQTYFHYAEDDLVNADLTADQKALASQKPVLTDNREKGDNYHGGTVTVDTRTILTFYFENMTRDMYAEVAYTDNYGNVKNYRVEGSAFVKHTTGYFGVAVDTLAMGDYNCMVKVTVYNANGTQYGFAKDSIGSYLARISGEPFESTAKAMESARKALHSNE